MANPLERDLQALLVAGGCWFVREGKGSHAIWYSPMTQRNFTVPHGIVSRMTANGILKQAGLPKSF